MTDCIQHKSETSEDASKTCIFCKIINKDIPSSKVYEDDDFIAILDISPANKGHTLIIPKKHSETLLDTEDEILKEMLPIAKKIAKAICQTTGCPGYNILINNYKVAGQLVPHIHLHIIPRTNKDDFQLEWTHKEYEENEMQKLADEIKSSL